MIKKNYLKELKTPTKYIKQGNKGKKVRKIQEWLNLWCFYDNNWVDSINIDGDYGPVTKQVVLKFQRFHNIVEDGMVGPQTWIHLVKPMQEAFFETNFMEDINIHQRVVEFAKQQLHSHPTELAQNLGPWVRAYMGGQDGVLQQWCAGFVCTVLDQAFSSQGLKFTKYHPDEVSCDNILKDAKEKKILFRHNQLKNEIYVPVPGDIFLIIAEDNPKDATHIGIVIEYQGEGIITTIEGNINPTKENKGRVAQKTRNIFYPDTDNIAIIKLNI